MLRHLNILGPLLLVALCHGCAKADPLEPTLEASVSGPASTPMAPSARTYPASPQQ